MTVPTTLGKFLEPALVKRPWLQKWKIPHPDLPAGFYILYKVKGDHWIEIPEKDSENSNPESQD